MMSARDGTIRIPSHLAKAVDEDSDDCPDRPRWLVALPVQVEEISCSGAGRPRSTESIAPVPPSSLQTHRSPANPRVLLGAEGALRLVPTAGLVASGTLA